MGQKHECHIKKTENELLNTFDNLDRKVEHTLLSPQKIDMKQCF
jgi:hypothetical protein